MAEEPKVYRGYGALRRGRLSQHSRDYFLTVCLRRPLSGLTQGPVASAISAELIHLENEGCWHARTWVVMPDHLHLLVTLKQTSSLSEALRLFKGQLSPALRTARLQWQPSFYDHCLRSGDDLLPVFLYIFLNPYRANLVEVTEKWLGYYCSTEDWEWFGPLTNEKLPFPEWLR